jgi:ABC-type branched-subunit amino acid transport system ATPase component
MLRLLDVTVSIAGVTVLRGVSPEIPPSRTVALIGRNGAGKTTTLRAIMGFATPSAGRILLDDRELGPLPPFDRPRLGIGYAPEDRRLFGGFTVEQNILLPAEVCRLGRAETRQRLERIYAVLPEVAAMRGRKAGSLSGGQGKMVALGRALMVGSRVVLLDEPFQGLAPALAHRYADALRRLRETAPDLAILVTESNPKLLTSLADVTYTIERGHIAPG